MVSFFGTETSPSSAVSSPTIIRKSVVLPAPFGPTSPTFSRIELEGGVDEQDLPAVLLAHARERDHTSSSPRPTSTASPPTRTRSIAPGSSVNRDVDAARAPHRHALTD